MDRDHRKLWLNGEIVPVKDAKINVLAPTAQFGANVFEGIRGYWDEEQGQLYLFRLKDHYKRLFQSIKLFRMGMPYTAEECEEYCKEVICANQYREDIAVRQTVFVEGFGSWYSKDPVGMFIAPIAKKRKEVPLTKGIRGCVSSWERISDSSMSPKAKVGANYINSRMAQLEALDSGYDSAIFMNRQGKIAEGPGSCIFILRDGVLVTPPITASILESITRDTILTLAREVLALPIEIRDIDRTELYICDEAFLCGSAAEVTPIISIDAYQVGDGTVGEITRKIHQTYLDAATGHIGIGNGWLTPVYG